MGLRGFPNVQGGVERHCEMLYTRMVANGFEPVVYARSGFVKPERHFYRGVEIIPMRHIKTAGIEAVTHTGLALLRAKRAGAKLVHMHAIGPAIWAGFARRLGIRVVVTHHGFDYRRDKWSEAGKAILRMGERVAIENADAIIVISQEIERAIRSRSPRGSVVNIPNGVEIPQGIPPTDPLKEWGLQPRNYALITARFVKEKRITDLMQAWARSGISDRCALAIAGDEDNPSAAGEEIRTMARNLGVVLTGRLSGPKLESIYAHAGFFVLPSTHEGLPISLLEAMSWRLPVIASDIAANLEVGLDTADYFPVTNIDALSARLVDKSSSLGSRRDYGELMQRYDWDRIAHKTADLYREVLARPRS